MNRVLAIVGPTAVGKTQLSLRLAQNFDVEIVSADSRQIYRYMDIGTAKPTPEELAQVPHHLIDIINPDEDFSLAEYQKLTYTAIDIIHKRNKIPILVGGFWPASMSTSDKSWNLTGSVTSWVRTIVPDGMTTSATGG